MIGKVLRGTRAGRLLYYLYGPGKANEHTDPHLVAGFRDPAELEPHPRPDGSRDFRRLTGLLAQPLAALRGPGYDEAGVALRASAPRRATGCCRTRSGRRLRPTIMDRTGLAPRGGRRWGCAGSRSATPPDHVHIVATLARQDGARPGIWNDFYRVREACRAAEERFGLRLTAPADRTAAPRARPGRRRSRPRGAAGTSRPG